MHRSRVLRFFSTDEMDQLFYQRLLLGDMTAIDEVWKNYKSIKQRRDFFSVLLKKTDIIYQVVCKHDDTLVLDWIWQHLNFSQRNKLLLDDSFSIFFTALGKDSFSHAKWLWDRYNTNQQNILLHLCVPELISKGKIYQLREIYDIATSQQQELIKTVCENLSLSMRDLLSENSRDILRAGWVSA